MRLLVLGGTVFVGRHAVQAALSNGHEITVFHRGKRGLDLFPEVEHVLGDRDGGLDALGERSFDIVIDCCGYLPRVVRQSAQAFAARCERYVFVSTISVYKREDVVGQDEDAELIELEDPTVEDIPTYYGGLKVLCEREVQSAYGDRGLIVRPGLVAGPYDPTNRFTYWVERMATDGPVIVPERLDQPMQLIDASDLGRFIVHGAESGLTGIYNAAGEQITLGDTLTACQMNGGNPEQVTVPWTWLEENDVKPWQDLPLTLGSDASSDGSFTVDSTRARNAGLSWTPLAETARKTWEWRRSLPADTAWPMGMSREREIQLVQQYRDTLR